MKTLVAAMLLSVGVSFGWSQDSKPPVTYAIIGLAHDHANGFIPRARNRPELQLAGIVEPNPDLVARYSRTLNLPTNLFSPSLEALLARTNIQAVATFTSTFQHRQVVEMCAARGIHVMMEKPLAVSLADARAIAAAAKKGGIHVIVNYETTWYLGNQSAYAIVHDQHAIGDLRKIVVHGEAEDAKEYLIPRGKHVTVLDGDEIKAGEPLMDGPRFTRSVESAFREMWLRWCANQAI